MIENVVNPQPLVQNQISKSNQIDYKKKLLERDYIGIFTSDYKKGELNIRSVSVLTYKRDLLKIQRVIPLTYSSLFRVMLFSWLFKYKGNDKKILGIIKSIDDRDMYVKEILNKMGRNRILMNRISKYIISKDTLTKDYKTLDLLIENKDKIFTENNFIEWYNVISEVTEKGNLAEEEIIKFINEEDDIKMYDATKLNEVDDINSLDILTTTIKGDNKTIQVKRIGGKSYLKHSWNDKKDGHVEYTFRIINTEIDINTYKKWKDGDFKYDYLYLVKGRDLYAINTNAINQIFRDNKNNNIYINLSVDDVWYPRMVQKYELI